MTLAPGTRIGSYEILGPLGSGGMGEVYRARDTRLDRDVAIKIVTDRLAGSPDARARFEREAKTISSLNHPNICTLHDVGHQDGLDYLVMELVEGETLAARLERARAQRDGGVLFAKVNRQLRALHGDPRWRPFLKKLGLED